MASLSWVAYIASASRTLGKRIRLAPVQPGAPSSAPALAGTVRCGALRHSQRLFHCLWRAIDHDQVGARRSLRLPDALFPIADVLDAEPVAQRERLLAQLELPPDAPHVNLFWNGYGNH